jgi:hypothetical protein
MTDPDMAVAFSAWWAKNVAPWSEFLLEAEDDLTDLEAHLAEHGFAIVRRMDPDLPG